MNIRNVRPRFSPFAFKHLAFPELVVQSNVGERLERAGADDVSVLRVHPVKGELSVLWGNQDPLMFATSIFVGELLSVGRRTIGLFQTTLVLMSGVVRNNLPWSLLELDTSQVLPAMGLRPLVDIGVNVLMDCMPHFDEWERS